MHRAVDIDRVRVLYTGFLSDLLAAALTQDCKHVTSGMLNVEKDSIKAVDGILAHIEEKRKKIGI